MNHKSNKIRKVWAVVALIVMLTMVFSSLAFSLQ